MAKERATSKEKKAEVVDSKDPKQAKIKYNYAFGSSVGTNREVLKETPAIVE